MMWQAVCPQQQAARARQQRLRLECTHAVIMMACGGAGSGTPSPAETGTLQLADAHQALLYLHELTAASRPGTQPAIPMSRSLNSVCIVPPFGLPMFRSSLAPVVESAAETPSGVLSPTRPGSPAVEDPEGEAAAADKDKRDAEEEGVTLEAVSTLLVGLPPVHLRQVWHRVKSVMH